MFINSELDEIRKLEEDKKSKEEAYEMRRNILKWLSPGDFEETHQRHFKKRFGNTGQWLLDDPRFRNWRDEKQSSLLWCYGARKSQFYPCVRSIWASILTCTYITAGSGKTVLAYGLYPHNCQEYNQLIFFMCYQLLGNRTPVHSLPTFDRHWYNICLLQL